MKKMKWLSALLIFAFCFILTGEMTQNYFTDFTEKFYYLDASTDDRSQLCSVMQQVSAKNHAPVFAVRKEYPAKRAARITVYISEQDSGTFRETYGLSPGTYPSLFSGTTEIVYRDFSEIQRDSDIERFYFSSASMEQMERIHHQISGSFRTSYIRRENAIFDPTGRRIGTIKE